MIDMDNDEQKLLDVRLCLLEPDDRVMIGLTPSIDCVLPEQLFNLQTVCLEVGYNMPISIPDLVFDLTGMTGTLSFQGRPYACFVPWVDVFSIANRSASQRYLYETEGIRALLLSSKQKVQSASSPQVSSPTTDHGTILPPMTNHLRDVSVAHGEVKQKNEWMKKIPAATKKRGRPEWLKVVK